MESQILTHQFYPVMNNIFKYLDVKTFLTLFNVSKQLRENLIIHFNTFNENDWFDFFKIKITKTKEGITIYDLGDIVDLRKFLRSQTTFINTFIEQLIKIDNIVKIIDYRKLSEDFVRKNIKYVKMEKISGLVKLSEAFIREFRNTLDWKMICKYQRLSGDFIKEHKNFVEWSILIKYNKIPTKHFYSFMYQFENEIKESMELWDRYRDCEYNFSDDFYWELGYE